VTPNDPGQPLDCASARRLIDAFLLDELPAGSGATLRRHLVGCAACTTELGGVTRLIALLGSLPAPAPAPDLDQRVILAALADHRRRHEHRSWLADLRTQVLRGAMRTTGTLVLTIVTVALLGAAFVFAASQLVAQLPVFTGGATIAPEVTPTPAQTVAPTTSPRPASPTPGIVVVTPGPTQAPPPEPTQVATPTPSPTEVATPTPSPTEVATPEPTPEPSASPAPTPQHTPTPTEKPRRTPPPQASPSPSPTPSP